MPLRRATTETLCPWLKTLANHGQFLLWAPAAPPLLAQKLSTLIVAVSHKHNRLPIPYRKGETVSCLSWGSFKADKTPLQIPIIFVIRQKYLTISIESFTNSQEFSFKSQKSALNVGLMERLQTTRSRHSKSSITDFECSRCRPWPIATYRQPVRLIIIWPNAVRLPAGLGREICVSLGNTSKEASPATRAPFKSCFTNLHRSVDQGCEHPCANGTVSFGDCPLGHQAFQSPDL